MNTPNPDNSPMGAHVLLIGATDQDTALLAPALASEQLVLLTTPTSEGADAVLQRHPPDLILLDTSSAESGGVAYGRQLCLKPSTADIPLIVMTAQPDDAEKIAAFDWGADDYVAKPFNPAELTARVKAVLRRKISTNAILTHGALTLDVVARRAFVDQLEVTLTKVEFELLRRFMESPDRAQRRADLVDAIWGPDSERIQTVVDTHVKNLRRKLGPAAAYIETVPGLGYRWASPARA